MKSADVLGIELQYASTSCSLQVKLAWTERSWSRDESWSLCRIVKFRIASPKLSWRGCLFGDGDILSCLVGLMTHGLLRTCPSNIGQGLLLRMKALGQVATVRPCTGQSNASVIVAVNNTVLQSVTGPAGS